MQLAALPHFPHPYLNPRLPVFWRGNSNGNPSAEFASPKHGFKQCVCEISFGRKKLQLSPKAPK
jgi:hypothetical protein